MRAKMAPNSLSVWGGGLAYLPYSEGAPLQSQHCAVFAHIVFVYLICVLSLQLYAQLL